jgi:AbiV family abortive infection protein
MSERDELSGAPEPLWEQGFLDRAAALTPEQIEDACRSAFANAVDLLEEADILRSTERCARAYFLTHIACEELGKLPILTTAAVAQQLGHDVDWRRIDRVLRSHDSKIKQVLFIDSVVGGQGLADGKAAYEADLKRMRLYTDMKNASLYSFAVEGRFGRPLEAIPCEIYDSFRALAEGRRNTFESMYMAPMRRAGGLPEFLEGLGSPRFKRMMAALTGEAGREAVEMYEATKDESKIRDLLERLVADAVETTPDPADVRPKDS